MTDEKRKIPAEKLYGGMSPDEDTLTEEEKAELVGENDEPETAGK